MIRTGLPANFYSLFLKIIVCVILFLYLIDNPLFATLSGLVTGSLLHLFTSYYDSIVELKDDTITFYFIRPIFFKEEHKLSDLDYAEIVQESPDKVLKDVWWKADNLSPIGYSKLIMYKGEFSQIIRFQTNQTNQSDLPNLQAALKKLFKK